MAKSTTSKPTTSKSATSKTATAKPARSKTKAAIKKPRAARVATTAPVATAPISNTPKPATDRVTVTKKQLVEDLVLQSGMKKGEARIALDAVLSVLNKALRQDADISAAPLGKIKTTRRKDTSNGEMVVCRVKLKSLD